MPPFILTLRNTLRRLEALPKDGPDADLIARLKGTLRGYFEHACLAHKIKPKDAWAWQPWWAQAWLRATRAWAWVRARFV